MRLQSPTFLLLFLCPFSTLRGLKREGDLIEFFAGIRNQHLCGTRGSHLVPQFPAGGKRVHLNQNLASDTYNTRAFACALRATPAFGENSLSYRLKSKPSLPVSLRPCGWPLFVATWATSYLRWTPSGRAPPCHVWACRETDITVPSRFVQYWDEGFPGSPVVRTPSCHCRTPGSFLGWGTKTPQASLCGKKKKKQTNWAVCIHSDYTYQFAKAFSWGRVGVGNTVFFSF